MADQDLATGRLIAVDGSRGADVAAAADALAEEVRDCGPACVISRWDASGLFGELASGSKNPLDVSARTLTLVYAADLAFRLRWEVRPALMAGNIVIVAPYVETAVALARAGGLPEKWLRDLFGFAPAPYVRGLARERKADRGWKRKPERGYQEYFAAMISSADRTIRHKKMRAATIEALDKTRNRKVLDLSKRGVRHAAEIVTDNPPAAASPPASPPRTARR